MGLALSDHATPHPDAAVDIAPNSCREGAFAQAFLLPVRRGDQFLVRYRAARLSVRKQSIGRDSAGIQVHAAAVLARLFSRRWASLAALRLPFMTPAAFRRVSAWPR
jgi:hypothetical protein